jgi:hypothetical protein
MANLGNTTRPAYVYDAETDTWLPIGVGAHTHDQIPASIVDAKGDLIVGTAADTVQKRTVGADGSYLVADSTQTTGLNWAGPSNISGKNFIINGALDIWQRGTSVSVTTTGQYTADRWITFNDSATRTLSRQLTNDLTNLPNIQYCARFQRPASTSSTGRLVFGQGLETSMSIPLIGKTVTLSFYARKGADFSGASNSIFALIQTGTGTDQNIMVGYTGQVNLIATDVVLTNTWQRFSYTATIPTSANEVGMQVGYTPSGTAGAADYYEITGVQLEIGSVATPFSRAAGNIQAELAACQRYYYRAVPGISTYGLFEHFGVATSSTTIYSSLKLPVTMRTNPSSVDFSTLRTFGQTTGVYNSISNVTINTGGDGSTSPQLAMLLLTSTGLTTNAIYGFGANNSTSAYIGVSAEL